MKKSDIFLDEDEKEVAEIIMSNDRIRKNYFSGHDADIIDRLHYFGLVSVSMDGLIFPTQKLIEVMRW